MEELQIENWIESSQHHQKNGHKFQFFRDQLYLIFMTFFLLINTSPNFLMMTFWIKLCNSLTCILFSKIQTIEPHYSRPAKMVGSPPLFLNIKTTNHDDALDKKKLPSHWLCIWKVCQPFKRGRPSSRLSDTDAKRRCGYPSNEICFDKDALYTLSGRIGKVVASNAVGWKVESRLWLSCTDLYYARGAQGVLPTRVGVRPVNWIYHLWRHSL